MDIRPVRNDDDLTAALTEIDRLWDAPDGSPESDKLDVLATLVEAYERKHHPVGQADPVDLLHYAIEELGRSQAELARILGSRSRASEILNRKVPLNLKQIRAISETWHLPIAALAKPYRQEREAGRAA